MSSAACRKSQAELRQDTSRRRRGRVPPVAMRAPDASRGRSRWRATGRGSAAPSAALATPRLPSSATGTAPTCSRERPAAAALSPCFQVTVTHPSNCATVRIFCVTGRSRTNFGPVTAEASNDAGGPGLYSPSIVRNLPAWCGSPRHKKFRGGARDILGRNFPIDGYDGRPENDATVGRRCCGACDLSAPMAYLRPSPRCTAPVHPASDPRGLTRGIIRRGACARSSDQDGSRRTKKALEMEV